jgi:hypothetical protein
LGKPSLRAETNPFATWQHKGCTLSKGPNTLKGDFPLQRGEMFSKRQTFLKGSKTLKEDAGILCRDCNTTPNASEIEARIELKW